MRPVSCYTRCAPMSIAQRVAREGVQGRDRERRLESGSVRVSIDSSGLSFARRFRTPSLKRCCVRFEAIYVGLLAFIPHMYKYGYTHLLTYTVADVESPELGREGAVELRAFHAR